MPPSFENYASVNRRNVGRIAERIVANQLEFYGFRVSDLNKEGLSANADLLAAGHDAVWQIQVKGSTNRPNEAWWIQYGHCTPSIVEKQEPMFNRRKSFYKADIVVLVAVRSPVEYRCVVLRSEDAEKAAQMNLDREYRRLTRDGRTPRPHKVFVLFEPRPKEGNKPPTVRRSLEIERNILRQGDNNWKILHR